MNPESHKTKADLRKFGLVMTVPLTLLGAFFWWKGRAAHPYLIGAAVFFLFSALIAPGFLRPIEKIWMKFADLMSAVTSRIILTLTFFLIITPLGLVLKLIGKDLLDTRTKNKRGTYWHPVEPDGPASRPNKPY